MKICTKCKIPKELDEFCKKKDSSDGYHIYCKICRNGISKSEYQNNIECKKAYYQINKEHKLKYQNQYRLDNLIKINKYNLKYQTDNKGKILNNTKIYRKKRYNVDEKFKLGMILRGRLHRTLKSQNAHKLNKTLILLGCTIIEFKQHLEQQFKPEMNWLNHGIIWEIDHIISVYNFDLKDSKQQEECFHYTNMRPLFKTTNIAKSFGYTNEVGNRNRERK